MLRQEASRDLPLFAAYPRLAEAVPWVPLGDWPTPVTEAGNFAAAHGLKLFHVKREDLSHAECGGNKVRGLEFLLADAARRNAGTLIIFGPAGSYHVCRTAWHARKLGIGTVALVLRQPSAEYVSLNLRAGLAAGTTYVVTNPVTLLPKLAWHVLKARYAGDGRSVVYVPAGGTSPLSCLGHVNAAFELKQQIEAGVLPEPDYLYAAMGSLGTMAGLAVGCKLAGLKTRLIGVVASSRWYCTPGRWARWAGRTIRFMRRHDPNVPHVTIKRSELTVVGTALGRGYAHFTPSATSLARQLWDCEAIRLDGTYTAKALDGAMQFIEQHGLTHAAHLFWQTHHQMPDAGETKPQSLPRGLRRYLSDDTQERDTSLA